MTTVQPITLTPRDVEVIAGYARGHTVARIARRLYVSEETVRSRTHAMCKRLDIKGARQAALVDYAYRHGHLPVASRETAGALSQRLTQVLDCTARGLGHRATAAELRLSVATVRGHREQLRRCFQAQSLAQVVARAWEAGVMGPARSMGAPRS
ncbi:LuxR C-terminal-related transcriptional regulator [Streptomyces sp. NBC_01485]|uniref:helix-turn-helix domain-containing protein n=1 Tax=Streptomyces sp. NBC_01485 TaxID=2903884 RepID=UPI002E37B25D|nr:LuxR C-terminal-related transcriptional regulator [Streptomyces sp. NBC_01485]